MEKLSLAALLDEDRERVMESLSRDRTLPAAQAALEKAVDRVAYRYTEGCDDPALRDGAQQILHATKNALPLMDAVGEARTWSAEYEAKGRRGVRLKPAALAALLGGLVLILATVLGALLAGRTGGLFAFVRVLLPVALGCGCLYAAGVLSAMPDKERPGRDEPSATRTEYLVDAEKAWHCLRGAMLQADGQLERLKEAAAARSVRESGQAPQSTIDPDALELFSELLELAYAVKDDGARESVAAMRFYLHNANIDVADYAQGRESWFEFLPADRTGTIRPALTSEGKVLRKGLACR